MEQALELVFKSIQEQIKQNNEATNTTLRQSLKGIRIYTDSNSQVLNAKMDALIEADKKRNGSIQDNSDRLEIVELQCTTFQRHTNLIQKLAKRWWIFTIVFLLAIFGSVLLYDYIDFRKTIEKKTGIVLKETP